MRDGDKNVGRASRFKKERRQHELENRLSQEVFFGDERFTSVPLGLAQSYILPVVVIRPQSAQLIGTCFNVLPSGLMITARHVIDEAKALVDSDPDSWMAVGWSKPGAKIRKYRGMRVEYRGVRRIAYSESIDIALIWPAKSNEQGVVDNIPTVSLDLLTPTQGTPIFACGYTRMTQNWVGQRGAAQVIDADVSFKATRGTIEELYPDGRDRFSMSFPSFQANARFVGGMSGGPVVNGHSGGVCGVVCSSFSSDDESLSYVSFGTLMISATGLGVVDGPDGDETGETFYHLIRRGEVRSTSGVEHISLEQLEPGHFGVRFS